MSLLKPFRAFCMVLFVGSVESLGAVSARDQPPIDPASPKAILIEEINAAAQGNAKRVEDLLYASRDQDSASLGPVAAIAVAKAQYGKAMAERFGDDVATALGVTGDAAIIRIRSANETIRGDQADVVVQSATESKRLVLMKAGHSWLCPIDAIIEPIQNAAPHEVGGRYINMSKVYSEMAAEIKAGQYSTAAEAARTTADRLRDAATGNDSQ